ncbi:MULTISPECIES: ABC transporter substrate-binding protein [unclassified Duganella]|uniref:ABC transporter substrate-binding protein n=1 Tax=unclassified Duganella TaxID=2636909 RepID=UPI000882C926|nr:MULTISPECIES: ABC transporter substrate-binding protein [unclassified Duganella]SDG53964.1 sulfonate transport system substrate-binding protein [Duganella sp. OV458]SDJ76652.1 sulfonate transport system substrate-binding protein [Duganella sp. OV510]
MRARLLLGRVVRQISLAALAAALSSAGAIGIARAEPETVRIATTAFTENGKAAISGVAYRVQQEGWLAAQLQQRGVKLEWLPVSGDTGATMNEAFASKRIDFAAYGDLPSVILNAGGVRTQVVVPSGRGADVFLLVAPGSQARSIRDLKGKRISIHRGRPWELGLRHLIEDNGLKVSDFTLVNMDIKPGAAALATGRVDALFVLGGDALEDRGAGRIIWSSKGKPERKMRAELWGRQEFTQANPALAQLVVTAWLRAQHWAAQDSNRDTFLLDATRAGVPERVVRRAYDDPQLAWKDRFSPVYDGLVYRHYREVLTFAHQQRLVRKQLKAEELLEPRFVDAGLRELGLTDFWKQEKQ